jgi:diguanylate cyclase (GGDEF)-like protein
MDILFKIGKKINNHFENKHRIVPIGWGIFLLLLFGYIDYKVTPETSLSIFYLFPVSLLTWFTDKKVGVMASLLSALAWFFIHYPSSYMENENSILVYSWNAVVMFSFLFIVSYLLIELRTAKERERESARLDPTTGIANKRLFFELARLEVKKVERYRHPLTVVYMDVDDFRKINDTLGRRVGDKLLQTVAETIKTTIRETDIIARMGGDDFVILLPGSGYEPANIVIRRVHKELLHSMQENDWSTTFSIGAATFINPPKSVDDMIQRADHLMYLAKNNGKNQLKHITSI